MRVRYAPILYAHFQRRETDSLALLPIVCCTSFEAIILFLFPIFTLHHHRAQNSAEAPTFAGVGWASVIHQYITYLSSAVLSDEIIILIYCSQHQSTKHIILYYPFLSSSPLLLTSCLLSLSFPLRSSFLPYGTYAACGRCKYYAFCFLSFGFSKQEARFRTQNTSAYRLCHLPLILPQIVLRKSGIFL